MSNKSPRGNVVLTYSNLIGKSAPENRLSLISTLSKDSLIRFLSRVNYRLRPKYLRVVDQSVQTQYELVQLFIRDEQRRRNFINIYNQHVHDKFNYGIIFTRQACLFAMEETLNSDEITNDGDYDWSFNDYENVLLYLLSINEHIYRAAHDNNELENREYEVLNPKTLYLSEFNVEINPLAAAARGYQLCDYLLGNDTYKFPFISYIREQYKVNPHEFIFDIYHKYCANENIDLNNDYIYLTDYEKHGLLFDNLSIRNKGKKSEALLNIRKSPFYKIRNGEYLLMDNTALISKCFSQLINDFWFDALRDPSISPEENSKIHINYKSYIGKFVEKLFRESIKSIFSNYRYSKLLTFDELDFKRGKDKIELADVYFRYSSKIIVGQAKSGVIYDDQKFGSTVEELYKRDKKKFFKNFGIDQLSKSISHIKEYIKHVDIGFEEKKMYQIYPIIFVTDTSLQTPLIAQVFNEVFNSELNREEFPKFNIKPLTVVHLSDLDKLEDHLIEKPGDIWEYLNKNFTDRKFIPPFYTTLDFYLDSLPFSTRIGNLVNAYSHFFVNK